MASFLFTPIGLALIDELYLRASAVDEVPLRGNVCEAGACDCDVSRARYDLPPLSELDLDAWVHGEAYPPYFTD